MRRTIARRCQISLFLVLATLSGSFVSSFGLLNRAKTSFRKMSVDNPVTEVAEAVNGDTYLEGIGEVGSSSFEMDFLSKRVPVVIRYSAESGLKPYFLTVAKKIKESHPDVVIDKVILPKVEVGDGDRNDNPTFEVLVDGKLVIRTSGRKDRSLSSTDNICVFVSMQEMETAISRARRRRRPSTVYGEDGNVSLELLKTKAVRHSKD